MPEPWKCCYCGKRGEGRPAWDEHHLSHRDLFIPDPPGSPPIAGARITADEVPAPSCEERLTHLEAFLASNLGYAPPVTTDEEEPEPDYEIDYSYMDRAANTPLPKLYGQPDLDDAVKKAHEEGRKAGLLEAAKQWRLTAHVTPPITAAFVADWLERMAASTPQQTQNDAAHASVANSGTGGAL